ncbi:ferritin-like domain-containing protein [Haloprofundus salinisoli]|uniref:YciE/YciF ferroxidase family protein n=1 Tax=Haloprofundus salinisoli TaxID=2876193 RepID=UPI001CCBCD32|nr:DUF892 family protein [Haloprofundus salinisoli]
MNIETLHDLFTYRLQSAYAVETELVDVLDELATAADVDALDDVADSSVRADLLDAFETHREETETHVERVETVFEVIERRPETRDVPMLDGLVDETQRFNNIVLNDALRVPYYLNAAATAEELEIRLYDQLLELAAALDLPEEATDALEANRSDDQEALDRLEALAAADELTAAFEELAAQSPET